MIGLIESQKLLEQFGRLPHVSSKLAQDERFDLILLVDRSPSMVLWASVVDSLCKTLKESGLFSTVHEWTLDVFETENEDGLNASAFIVQHDDHVYSSRKKLIVVVSDCGSMAWDNGAVYNLLVPMSKTSLLTIFNPLPDSLWETTAIGYAPPFHLQLTENKQVESVTDFTVTSVGRREVDVSDVVVFPVIPLTEGALERWVNTVSGHVDLDTLTVAYDFKPISQVELDNLSERLAGLGIERVPRTPTIEDKYTRYCAQLPPVSRHLMSYLAAVPAQCKLTIPLMQQIQKELMPESTLYDFVRLFYLGVITRFSKQTKRTGILRPEEIAFDFEAGQGMRDLLSGFVPYSAIDEIEMIVQRYYKETEHQNQTKR